MTSNPMEHGVIASVRNNTFGFIRADADPTRANVFVHVNNLQRGYLIPGRRVRFERRETDKGPRAEAVEVLD